MLFALTFLAASLLPGAGPAPTHQTPAPADTTRQFRGFANATFAWGTLVLRNGKVLRAYLPTVPIPDLALAVPYYLAAPEAGKLPKPKLVAVPAVQSMRVGNQYWELLTLGKADEGSLVRRLQGGVVDLFAAQAGPSLVLTALGSNPVLSSPVDAAKPDRADAPVIWYLRRAGSPPVRVAPSNFASQVASFLRDDPELARRVAAGQAGHRYEDLERLVQQYNQRNNRRARP